MLNKLVGARGFEAPTMPHLYYVSQSISIKCSTFLKSGSPVTRAASYFIAVAAKARGLRRGRLGNMHLLGEDY